MERRRRDSGKEVELNGVEEGKDIRCQMEKEERQMAKEHWQRQIGE